MHKGGDPPALGPLEASLPSVSPERRRVELSTSGLLVAELQVLRVVYETLWWGDLHGDTSGCLGHSLSPKVISSPSPASMLHPQEPCQAQNPVTHPTHGSTRPPHVGFHLPRDRRCLLWTCVILCPKNSSQFFRKCPDNYQ